MTTEDRYWLLPDQEPATVGSIVAFAAAEGARTIDVSPLMGAGGDRAVVKVSPGWHPGEPSMEDLEALTAEARAFLSGTMRGGARVRFARKAPAHLGELQARLALEGVDPGRFLGRLLFGFHQRPEEAAEFEELLRQREEVAARAREPFYFHPVYVADGRGLNTLVADQWAANRYTAALPPRLQWELKNYAGLARPFLRTSPTLQTAEQALARLALFFIADPELRWNDQLAAPSLNPTMFAMEAAGEALLRTVRGGFEPADVAALAQALLESIRRFAEVAGLLAPDTTRNTWAAHEARADLAEALATGNAEGEAAARAALEAANKAPLSDDGEGHLSPMVPPWRLLTEEGKPVASDGMLWLDDVFADALALTGGLRGRALADEVREEARQRWKTRDAWHLWHLWRRWFVKGDTSDPDRAGTRLGHAPLAAVLLAEALWVDVVQPRLKAERERALARAGVSRPAVLHATAVEVLSPLMNKASTPFLPGLDDGRIMVGNRKQREIGKLPALADERALTELRRALAEASSPASHRLVTKMVLASHEQWESGGDGEKVDIAGGWKGVGDWLALRSNADVETVKRVARLFAEAEWYMPKGLQKGGIEKGSGLWLLEEGRSLIRFRLSTLLAPGEAARLADKHNGTGTSPAARRARQLVVVLPHDPPLSGARRNDRGAVWAMQAGFRIELTERAEELAERGGIAMDEAAWQRLARGAGLPLDSLARVLDTWRAGDTEAPALILEPERGLVTLADVYEREREFIRTSGESRTNGRVNAKLGKAKKTARQRKAPR